MSVNAGESVVGVYVGSELISGGKNPSIIVNHYIYTWNNTSTSDTIVNGNNYTKATIKAIEAYNAYGTVAGTLNGASIPKLNANEEHTVDIEGDATFSATYSGTDRVHIKITLHN